MSSKQYIISNHELERLQATQLELILEVKRICKKNNIHFNMVGGTMLGAIRHHGYIPWDDDADIGFLRKEYEKFRNACRDNLDNEKYYLQDFRDTNGYRWGYGKLRKKGTEFLRLNQENMPYNQGISIDLMPFDNVPDNFILKKIHKFRCFLFRKIFWSKVGKKTEKNMLIRLLYIVFSLIPEEVVKKSFEKFIDNGSRKKTKMVRILTFPTPPKVDGYKREWYTNLKSYIFSGYALPGARDYDGYLRKKYGDYMLLPPEEKRKIHPISKLRFEGELN